MTVEDAVQEEQMDENEERMVNEEYKIWKKNSPFLYDLVMTSSLDWPSLTVDWALDKVSPPDSDCSNYKLIVGTHTSENENEFIKIYQVKLPNEHVEVDVRKFESHHGFKGFGLPGNDQKIELKARIAHNKEAHRALHCPYEKFLLATKCMTGDVCVFDYSKHSLIAPKDHAITPLLTLKGCNQQGWALGWSDAKEGYIASGGDDLKICVWDIRGSSGPNVDPIVSFNNGHSKNIEDLAFSPSDEKMVVTVADDGYMALRDITSPPAAKPTAACMAHEGGANTVSWSKFNNNLIATAGVDKRVCLWDARKLVVPLHAMEGHTKDVMRVHFAPFAANVLASAGYDRRVNIWDMSKIGQEQSASEAEDGVPELIFVHSGHVAKVSDFAWNPNPGAEWVIASVSEDNVMQIWQPSENIYVDDVDEENEMDLE